MLDLNELNKALESLNSNNDKIAIKMLLQEKAILLHQQEVNMHLQSIQDYFLRYMETTTSKTIEKLYNYSNGITTFANMISLYKITGELALNSTEHINLVTKNCLESIEDKLEEKMSDKLHVDLVNIWDDDGKITYLENRKNRAYQYFSTDQFQFLNNFLGDEKELYISKNNSLLYAESDYGKSYLLGLKMRK